MTPGLGEAAWLLSQWIEHYLGDCSGGSFDSDLLLRSGAFLQAHAPEFMAGICKEREEALQTLRSAGVVYADTGKPV